MRPSLSLWVTAGVQRGLATIIIAHMMFNISFVVVTVRARIAGFNRSLEEAAMDLGADELTTFRKVTLPLIFPGIMAGALLAFALSIDDYVITSFVSGQTTTFPLWVFGASRFGVPPEVNVLGTLIFVFAFVLIVAQILWARRRGSTSGTRRERLAIDLPDTFPRLGRPSSESFRSSGTIARIVPGIANTSRECAPDVSPCEPGRDLTQPLRFDGVVDPG